MKKKKNIFTILISCLSALLVALIMLVIFDVLKLWIFLTCFSVLLAIDVVFIVLLFKIVKKIKISKMNAKTSVKSTGNYMLDIYGVLGIEPQYDKDGNLINIYDLLHIKPIYDDNGERVLTIYELLGITPRFDKEGKEIPSYFVIKNRVGKFAKVSLSTAFLTRKLTPEEEEQKLIRETLKQKLDEAQKAGDKGKEKAIKKAINAKDKAKSKSASKPEKATPFKGAPAADFVKKIEIKSNSSGGGGGGKDKSKDKGKDSKPAQGQKQDDKNGGNTTNKQQGTGQKTDDTVKETESSDNAYYVVIRGDGDSGNAPEPGSEE